MYKNNSNCLIEGKGSGEWESNSNCKINLVKSVLGMKGCSNCVIEGDVTGKLENNSNCQIKLFQSYLGMKGCSNGDIQGRGNDLEVIQCSNLSFQGDDNNCSFKGTSNLRYEGIKGSCTLTKCSNTTITGNSNNVRAEGNSNLSVGGDGNNVSVVGTYNHNLSPAHLTSDSSTNVNVVTIRGNGGQSRMGGWFTRTGTNWRFTIQYVKQAIIRYKTYEVGMFKFDVDSQSHHVDVKIDTSVLDSFQATQLTGGYLFNGTKAGQNEQLKLLGSKVETTSLPNVYRVTESSVSGL